MTKENVIIKKDTTSNWNKAKNFIPRDGEIIVYSDLFACIKIGDGMTKINDLPFYHSYDYNITNDILEINGGGNSTNVN